jgi:hypothetical protein
MSLASKVPWMIFCLERKQPFWKLKLQGFKNSKFKLSPNGGLILGESSSLSRGMIKSAVSVSIWKILPNPLERLRPSAVLAAFATLNGIVAVFQYWLSRYNESVFTPLHLALSLVAALCFASAKIKSLSSLSHVWGRLAMVFGIVFFFELANVLPWHIDVKFSGVYISEALLVITLLLVTVTFVRDQRRGLIAFLLASLFAVLFIFSVHFEPFSSHEYLEFAMLLCGELFLMALYFDNASKAPLVPPRQVGSLARYLHSNRFIRHTSKHPPVKAAYYPILKEAAVFLAIFVLLARAGRKVKLASGVSYFGQASDMVDLWFKDGIDPPSYYQLELYEAHNRLHAPEFLTRFETKNGLFTELNGRRENLVGGNDMGNKAFFAEFCQNSNLPYPATLGIVGPSHIEIDPALLKRDLFIKPRNGKGAFNACGVTFVAGRYVDENGHCMTLDELITRVKDKADGDTMLIQPWLRNHPDISDLAKDSLLAFRVVTCLNEQDEPEVVLAMLRLLCMLEPDWKSDAWLADLEFGSAIDLESGVMGLLLGDGFDNVPHRFARHPYTDSAIVGRKLEQWPAICELAVNAHTMLKHRVAIGWDIALTPEGPVLLEGNKSFDVMFLQRVQMKPIGATRFGDLLVHHMREMFLKPEDAPVIATNRSQLQSLTTASGP